MNTDVLVHVYLFVIIQLKKKNEFLIVFMDYLHSSKMKRSLYLTLIFVLYISCSSVFSYEIIKTSKDVTNMELILDVRTYDDGTYMLYGWDKILFVFPNDSSAEIDRKKYLRNGYNNIRTYSLTKNYFLYLYGKDFDQYEDIIDWNGNIILK